MFIVRYAGWHFAVVCCLHGILAVRHAGGHAGHLSRLLYCMLVACCALVGLHAGCMLGVREQSRM